MPRALDPQQRFAHVLDESAPEGKRPTVYYRGHSLREHRVIEEAIVKIGQAQSISETIDLLLEAIKPFVVGWENIGEEFKFERLADMLDELEAWDLLGQIRFNGRLSLEDKKKSES